MSTFLTRRKFLSLFVAVFAAFTMTMLLAPTAFAGTPTDPDYSISTYNVGPALASGDNAQHVVVTIDYGQTVSVADTDAVMNGLTVEIAGYDITADNYKRPVDVSVSGNTLVLDIGNVYTVDEYGDPVAPTFTAQYGGVIEIDGTPTGVTAGVTAVGALDIYTVIPTGVHVSMTGGAGTSTVSATVDHAANVRGMVHVAVYDASTGNMVPVNSSTTAGNLQVGAYVTHAHAFMTLTTANFASNIAGFSLPAGYGITASGSNLTLTGPTGSELYLYIFDDNMLQSLGWTFSGVVSNDGVMPGFEPGV